MSETVFITGLLLSMIAMFVVMGVWNRRTRGVPGGPIHLKLGSALSWQSLAAVLGGFVVGGGLIAAVAIGLEFALEADGALYAMWLLPWAIPPMLPLARWGLEVAAPGEIEVDAHRIVVTWGGEVLDLHRRDARLEESIAPASDGGLWQLRIDGAGHPLVVQAPFRGLFGLKELEKLRAEGVPDRPRDPTGLNLLADLHEVLALRRALQPSRAS